MPERITVYKRDLLGGAAIGAVLMTGFGWWYMRQTDPTVPPEVMIVGMVALTIGILVAETFEVEVDDLDGRPGSGIRRVRRLMIIGAIIGGATVGGLLSWCGADGALLPGRALNT